MKAVNILEPHDTITATCWCRPLVLQTMGGGMSDSISFKSCYSGTPENNAKWVRVVDQIGPHWIDKTVAEFNESMSYEFILGDPPREHRLNMSDYSSMSDLHEKLV